ncbi:MAG TPA: glycosyltransferase 61 family protein [Acetobacteraceae bacterium]|nr:glycosyltransferase 61 family protein [Acetobacteraceae bacterium]
MGYGCWTGWSPIITSPDRIDAGSVRTSGLIRLGSHLAPRIRLAGEASPAPLPRLALETEKFTAPEWIGFHRNGTAVPPFDLAALGPLPLTLNGPGLVWLGDALIADPSVLPVYALAELERHPEALLARPRALPIRRNPRPALVFHGWGVRVYGHFLIEMLPKLLLAKRFPNLFSGLLPVLDRQMPEWFRAILASQFGIGEAEAIWFDSAQEQLHLERAVLLPHLLRPGGFHPAARTLFADFAAIAQEAPPASAERLFVARGEHENSAAPRRRLVNEAELAEIAASEFGFLPVYPEQLLFPRQIGLFAQARIILGQTGSAMHNALFSPSGAIIGQIRFAAPDQSYIAALNGQRIAYLTEGVVEFKPGIWQAEPERFRRFVAALVNCDQQSGPSEPAAGR